MAETLEFDPADAIDHCEAASTPFLRYIWSEAANNSLDKGEGREAAIKAGNRAVIRATR